MSYNQYTLNELADMHLIYGECNSNSLASARRYAEKFPNRRIPHSSTFAAVDRRFREKGTFLHHTIEHSRPRSVRTPNFEENVLNAVAEHPHTSVRRIAAELEVQKSTVHRVLKEQQLHPYHLRRIHELLPQDPNSRLNFCNWFKGKQNEDNNFVNTILMTDEACFTKNGAINLHNLHEWSDENPRATIVNHSQYQFKINVWAGVVGNCLLGPIELPQRLNGPHYLDFIQNTLPQLLEDVDLATRREMWFMHDGAPPHYALEVRQFLNNQFPRRWIGRGEEAPVKWPPRSPDLNILDFYFWGFMKGKVYATPVETRQELWERILHASDLVRQDVSVLFGARQSLIRRVNLCVEVNGQQFEHLL